MSEHPSDNITRLLIELSNGDRDAVDLLLPVIYDELRKLAANYLRRERPDHTLQPTALVHEAYLRLADQTHAEWPRFFVERIVACAPPVACTSTEPSARLATAPRRPSSDPTRRVHCRKPTPWRPPTCRSSR